MADKAYITPKVLKWARETARMSVEIASLKISVSSDRLTEWEEGIGQPTIRQAQTLAKAYKRPFALFFLPDIPYDFTPLKDFRSKNAKPYLGEELIDYEDLSLKIEQVGDKKRIMKGLTLLNIIRMSFEENLKWDFYYRGNKISARIMDPEFYKLIDKGETFAKGDTLEVELQINQLFEESVNTFVNKSYQINRILNHYKRAEQKKIDFDEGEI